MLQQIKSLFQKPAFTNTKHIIKPAFTCGGIQYYEFDNIHNLPWKRGLKFLSVYNELDMKCDRFYLEKHCEAVDKILTEGDGQRIGLNELLKVKQLNEQMKERLKMIYHEDLVYKVASIVFFDSSENPDDWEWQYALKKIEHWKKHEDVGAFFLHEPIRRLIPCLSSSAFNIPAYSEAQKALDGLQLENILASLYSNPKSASPGFMQRYFWEGMSRGSR